GISRKSSGLSKEAGRWQRARRSQRFGPTAELLANDLAQGVGGETDEQRLVGLAIARLHVEPVGGARQIVERTDNVLELRLGAQLQNPVAFPGGEDVIQEQRFPGDAVVVYSREAQPFVDRIISQARAQVIRQAAERALAVGGCFQRDLRWELIRARDSIATA